MTPEQNLRIRQFYTEVVQDPTLFPGNPVGQRALANECLRLLNYVVVDGKFIDKDKVQSAKYGQQVAYECQWEADTLAVEAETPKTVPAEKYADAQNQIVALFRRVKQLEKELDEATQNNSADETDSSEPSEDTEVREAVLREDV